MLHNIVHCLCFIALFLRFIAVVMPCGFVHVTQHCTLLMSHCIVFTFYSGCYALWHCSCYTTLYIAYVSLHCFLRFIAFIMPCGFVRVTLHCTCASWCLLLWYCVVPPFFGHTIFWFTICFVCLFSITDVAGGVQGLKSLADLVLLKPF